MLRVGAGGGVQKVTPKVLSFRQAAPGQPAARPAPAAQVANAPTSWAAGASAWDDEEEL
ncbi:unnamed protein product [Prorocentrum cordatum]|uniref:Uncharacterized protein n=1 Tax=Prorocentrum cordatum TaxID=2364126 RepID=A0ABN9TMQ3_9DINO|nr:unnamed protein product [Polarella glacialis]